MNENFDKINALNAEQAQLLSNLSANTSSIGDWKVVKCYEAKLQGKEMPYDVDALLAARQAARDRINAIREELKELEAE